MMNLRCVALVLVALLAGARPSYADMQSDPIAAMVARVKPAVVQIISVRPPPDPASPASADAPKTVSEARPTTGIGSGFIIDPKGFVATNKHVVENAVSVFVVTNDSVRHRARVVGVTHNADIALLKIDSAGGMPSVPYGNSDKLAVGEKVVAIGSPFGFEGTVTTGIVSAINRDIMESPFDDYIQTDAAINHGNSGGPLFNLAGEVVGMNSVLFAPGAGSVGVGFAIPSNDLNVVLTWLKNTGHVKAGMLPIRTQPVTWMLAQAMATEDLKGAIVAGMDEAGERMMDWRIKPGDIVHTINGLVVWDPRDLARKAAVLPVGSDAELGLQRGDERLTVHVKIQAYPEAPVPETSMAKARIIGLDLAAIPKQGVTVTDVDLKGTAADSGIQKGDVILQVQQASVTDPSQALHLMELQTAAKRPYAALLVLREGKTTWMPVGVPE